MVRLLTVLLWMCTPTARASDLVVRTFTVAQGLPNNWVSAVAVDSDGHVWAGGPTSLTRYDGASMRLYGEDVVRMLVRDLRTGPHGEVVARESDGRVHELVGDRVVNVKGPDGESLIATSVLVEDSGSLLAATSAGLLRRSALGEWTVLLDDERARDVRSMQRGAGGQLLLGTSSDWWTLHMPSAAWHHVTPSTTPSYGIAQDGHLWLLNSFPAVLQHVRPDGTVEEVYRTRHAHLRGVTSFEGGVVVADIDGLHSFFPDGRKERLGPRQHLGKVTAVDAQGGLWVASYAGLNHLPEPHLRRWGTEDGLHGTAVRYLEPSAEGLWVTVWGGASRILADGTVQAPDGRLSSGHLCTDDDGVIWTLGGGSWRGTLYLQGLDADGHQVADYAVGTGTTTHEPGCAPASDGHVWYYIADRLWLSRGVENAPQDMGRVPIDSRGYNQVLEDRSGRLWAVSGATACHAQGAAALRGQARWTCVPVDTSTLIMSVSETEQGSIWVATRDRGMQAFTGAGFKPLPGNAELPSSNVRNAVPSLRGGMWVLGAHGATRVHDRPSSELGWEVVEELPYWIGGALGAVKDLVEEPDGTLWLATQDGVVRMPGRVRDVPDAPPEVRWGEVRVDGELHDVGSPVQFPSATSRLSLRVSTTNYRAPSRIQFRHRIDAGTWSAATHHPALELSVLASGSHEVELVASHDGVSWSAEPARIAVFVPSPWWANAWLWLAVCVVVGGIIGVFLQVRHRAAMQLQQLRTRMAMDMHDELGAGLASIGLLAGLAEVEAPTDQARQLTARISNDAMVLGGSVSNIVWSLRQAQPDVVALARFLHDRSASVLPALHADHSVHLRVDIDYTPPNLDLPRLRALQLIGLEALTNVGRHASASQVWISVGRKDGRHALCIADDGLGFDKSNIQARVGGGLGTTSMRTRAQESGMELEMRTSVGSGTEVIVWLYRQRRGLRRWLGRT